MSAAEQRQFADAVANASRRDDVCPAVQNLYRALQDAIDLRKPICATSGRCCRFDEFGHRLFVTTLELGAFIRELGPFTPSSQACPLQQGKFCSVHAIRPFGCRVFFCDETATDWQQEQYARFHKEFQRLHEVMAVPYFYVEWREALGAIGLSDPKTDVVIPSGL